MKVCLVMLWVFMCAVSSMAVEGYRATICMANGNTVQTEYFGEEGSIWDYFLKGKLNGQDVQYKLSELKEVIFSDYETRRYYRTTHDNYSGGVVVVSSSGKRFVLTSCTVGDYGELEYCYLDPVTDGRRFTKTTIQKNIVSIKIGEHVGKMKKNPTTGEFFPAIYSFDPFTGQKLEWENPE